MKIISWNVNSIRIRKHQLLELIKKENPDFVCLQEIKSSNHMKVNEDIWEIGEINTKYNEKINII